MFLLLVSLYEFGQFLRILLWIFLPMVIVAMLVTTWLHYRRKRKTQDEMTLSMEGLDLSADPEVLIAALSRMTAAGDLRRSFSIDSESAVSGDSGLPVTGASGLGATGESGLGMTDEPGLGGGNEPVSFSAGEQELTEDTRDKMYRGILWMKEKYEQYRDLADQRIEQLKEELAKTEKKYQDLLAAQPQAPVVIATAGGETAGMDQRIENVPLQQQLEEKDRHIAELQNQLQVQSQKTEELVARLQHSSQLLLNISRELDTSALLDKPALPSQPQA